ncbi:hypothetical protein NKR19_g2533 [Coniochaeta hoffmannii]|uniref:BZIP domain-containing protein n=1 Tax=Coniochaeta hoffmannii TaxID=91930 RepID=A0AA38S5A4_9PEZI|nr:hypothetical protein NKR19_g2533 [Coniochaeta hoffmannii]
MNRSPSAEAPKSQKRKGTRSVSTLTPSQLARKRANDREAQRAIRARTKEHIERLEREIEELKSRNTRDETVQELLRRNKALEQEVAALRKTLGLQTGRTYPPTPYPETVSAAGSEVSSRTSSFGQNSGEYSGLPPFGSPYMPTSEPCEPWTPGLNYTPSVVSSPTSSVGNADDYIPGYIPTSVPTSMMDGGAVMSQTSVPCLESKSQSNYPPPSGPQQGSCMPQQPWMLYPSYYPQSPAI